jgi:hypothetical protein
MLSRAILCCAVQAHPDVPVVENLEDLWLVTKLQNERKAKEERQKQKKLQVRHAGGVAGLV